MANCFTIRTNYEMTCADLVDVEFVDDVIEDSPEVIEEVDDLHRSALGCQCRERYNVREVNGRFLVEFGQHVRAELEAVCHRPNM